MSTSKTYTKRTNAKRAGVQAGIPEDQVEITVHKEKGEVRFGFKQKEHTVAPAQATAAAKPVSAPKAPAEQREARNGVKRPRAGGACARVWEHLDKHGDMAVTDIKAWAEKEGLNPGNAAIEIYQWRKFTGVKKAPKK